MGAIKSEKLSVKEIEFHQSRSENHIHTLITLSESMENLQRYVWGIILHSDLYRGCITIMRELHGVSSPDILITPSPFKREPDAECECEQKHTAEVMQICPAAIRLRGEGRTKSFFGLPEREQKWTLEEISEYVKVSALNLFDGENFQ